MYQKRSELMNGIRETRDALDRRIACNEQFSDYKMAGRHEGELGGIVGWSEMGRTHFTVTVQLLLHYHHPFDR